MPGRFIVSFDCEGKWGMADCLSDALAARLTSANIERAYDQIAVQLARFRLKATFAFVGAFTLRPEEFASFDEDLVGLSELGGKWLSRVRQDLAMGVLDGWFVPGALRRIQAERGHEIATHGFTHLSLGAGDCSPEIFHAEMAMALRAAALRGWQPRTIVYPRNAIGHVRLLSHYDIVGYREKLWPQCHGALRQISSLASEIWPWARAQRAPVPTRPVAIPPGHILNFWHNPGRRLIARRLTRERWRRILRHASKTGGVAHLWSHPHNFISDPELIDVFAGILADAAKLIAAGELINQTQFEYSASVLNDYSTSRR